DRLIECGQEHRGHEGAEDQNDRSLCENDRCLLRSLGCCTHADSSLKIVRRSVTSPSMTGAESPSNLGSRVSVPLSASLARAAPASARREAGSSSSAELSKDDSWRAGAGAEAARGLPSRRRWMIWRKRRALLPSRDICSCSSEGSCLSMRW